MISALVTCLDCGVVLVRFDGVDPANQQAVGMLQSGLGMLAALPDLGERVAHACPTPRPAAPADVRCASCGGPGPLFLSPRAVLLNGGICADCMDQDW